MSYYIVGDEELIRRIPQSPSHIEEDAEGNAIRDEHGRPQLTSAIFKYMPKHAHDGVSVDILNIWLRTGTEAQALEQAVFAQTTRTGAGFIAGIIWASEPLNQGLECAHDPTPAVDAQPANPAHALIKGNIDKSMARRFADACRLVEKTDSGKLHYCGPRQNTKV